MDEKKEVLKLIGDFYESHGNCDYSGLKNAVTRLESIIEEVYDLPFLEYFSELYSGRAAYNIFAEAKNYPIESIMRELFQNAFDSYYNVNDIKLSLNFKGDGVISLAYNEIGFTLEQFLYFLSVGRSENDLQREGRFGIGAKSVFMNAKHFAMRSNSFEFSVRNKDGKLTVESLNCHNLPFKGTEITITVDKSHYKNIEENFLNLTSRRGMYMNIMDLCFAFNRKKILNIHENLIETTERTFNIAVSKDGRFQTVYRIENYMNPAVFKNTIRFSKDGRGIIDFISYEYNGVVILVPFAMSKSRREGVMEIISSRYNLFSTYELTGLLSLEDKSILNTKLSAFFISVPNTCITPQRTGLSPKDEIAVRDVLKEALAAFINENKSYFILEVEERLMEFDYSVFSPVSFLFDFVKKYMFNGGGGLNLENVFFDTLSFKFQNEDEVVPFKTIAENGFYHKTICVPCNEHQSGVARRRYINEELERMESALADLSGKTICTAYEWENGEEKGKEFLYKVYRGDKTYLFAEALGLDLCERFKNITENKWGEGDPSSNTETLINSDGFENLIESEYDAEPEENYMQNLEIPNDFQNPNEEPIVLEAPPSGHPVNNKIHEEEEDLNDERSSDPLNNSEVFENVTKEKPKKFEFLSKTTKVNRILHDQLDLQLKPRLPLKKEEFKELRILAQKLDPHCDNPDYKYYFLKDLNFKYFGYGGYCPICGFESLTLNPFELYYFSIRLKENLIFKFSLVLCANDAAAAESWIVENLIIGGMKPFEWWDFMENAEQISPSLLEVHLSYRERIAYGAPDVFESYDPPTILSTSTRIKNFFLTPLLAANWIEYNKQSNL